MTTPHKALLFQARDALDHFDDIEKTEAAIEALQAAIDAPDPEPAAYSYTAQVARHSMHSPITVDDFGGDYNLFHAYGMTNSDLTPLYDHPPEAREPLTREKIAALIPSNADMQFKVNPANFILKFVRAIEAAHGIVPKVQT